VVFKIERIERAIGRSIMQHTSDKVIARVIQQDCWQGFRLRKLAIRSDGHHPVPAMLLLPDGEGAPYPCVIAVHGFTDKKEAWIELDGYTKGGNVSLGLLRNGYAVLALDMYHHGENRDDRLSVTDDELINEHWEMFFAETLRGIHDAIAYVDLNEDLDAERIGFLSYSLGGMFGFKIANSTPRIKAVATCVAPVFKEDDDEYAPYNNVDHLSGTPFLMVAAEKDEEVDLAEAQWLFSRLPGENKRFVSFDSGHSLPPDYVDVVVNWFASCL
jgi:dienelactone hydrolase